MTNRRAGAQRREDGAGDGQANSSAAAALQPSIVVIALRGRLIEAVFSQPPVQLRARQTETFGRLRLVPAALAHHGFNGLSFDGVQIVTLSGVRVVAVT